MKYKRNTPALIRDRLKMKDCIIRNLKRELDELEIKYETLLFSLKKKD